VTDDQQNKRGRHGSKTLAQHEADAKAVQDKIERLRALRLAHEAATKPAAPRSAPAAAKRPAAAKGKAAAPARGASTLSEWLATQQRQGRRT
jgi:hypothetical protein